MGVMWLLSFFFETIASLSLSLTKKATTQTPQQLIDADESLSEEIIFLTRLH